MPGYQFEDLPLRITNEQRLAAYLALGIADPYGVFEVRICLDEVEVKHTAYDDNGEPLMCQGGLTYQTIAVPIVKEGTDAQD